jgi:hypothetical protein
LRALRTILVALVGAALVVWPRAGRADDWQFVPKTPQDAARAAAFGVYPVRLFELRLSYRYIHGGGNATDLTVRTTVAMPYVLVPGLRISNMYTLIRVDLPITSLNFGGMSVGGIGDVHVLDGAIKYFKRTAFGFGLGVTFPSATDVHLGLGKLGIGPLAGVSVWLVKGKLSTGLYFENQWSVAGTDARPGFNYLLFAPELVLYLPHATFIQWDPIMIFNWNRDGQATVPVNLELGHAFSSRLVMGLQPEWIVAGPTKNDVLVRLIVSYIGW